MRRSVFALAFVATLLVMLFVQGSSPLRHAHAVPSGGGDPLYILPLGDSITHADRHHNSYRRPLWHALQNEGLEVDFVGSMRTNYPGELPPNPDYDLDHEGHWGWRADQIISGIPGSGQGKLEDWLESYTPDVVLMHLGTNDMGYGQTITSTLADLKGIIGLLRADNPQVDVLIAQLIPAANSALNARITALNRRIPELAAEEDRPDSRVLVVDQNSGFDPEEDTYDRVHPNAEGEAKIAERWFDELTSEICGAGKLIVDIHTANSYKQEARGRR